MLLESYVVLVGVVLVGVVVVALFVAWVLIGGMA